MGRMVMYAVGSEVEVVEAEDVDVLVVSAVAEDRSWTGRLQPARQAHSARGRMRPR